MTTIYIYITRGSLLGQLMKIDAATAVLACPSVARMCVEIDLLNKFSNRVWIRCGYGAFGNRLVMSEFHSIAASL